MASTPNLGDHVHYMLTERDAEQINTRRMAAPDAARGNRVQAGDVFPGVVVSVWDTNVNLHVWLDGNDAHWATSTPAADQPKPGHYVRIR